MCVGIRVDEALNICPNIDLTDVETSGIVPRAFMFKFIDLQDITTMVERHFCLGKCEP